MHQPQPSATRAPRPDIKPALQPRVPPWCSWALSGVATLVWFVAVLGLGLGGRVLGHWESSVTMLFGSFLAGSSPEGGGAVAFPIFTKALHVSAPVARTFGLSIQAVGMTMATLSILAFRRVIHVRAVVLASIAAISGFLLSVVAFGYPDSVFWPSTIPGPWVKATFSVVLATTSVLMLRHLRHDDSDHPPMDWNIRLDVGLVLLAAAGGFLSSLTGTGANILVFLFLVVLADVRPKVALPSAVVVMAAVSIVGFVLFGLIDRQLAVEVAGDQVIAVGGESVSLVASEADLLGLWLAAIPVVVWGAPLGSLVAALVRERHLVRFVAALAATEVATTFVLVPELRVDSALITYLVVGLATVPPAFVILGRNRVRVFAQPHELSRSQSPKVL